MMALSKALSVAFQHYQAGDFVQAEQRYRQILQRDPQYAGAWYLLGLLTHKTNRPDEAAHCFGQVVEFEPDNIKARANLGAVLVVLKKFTDATRILQTVIETEPNYVDAYYNLGVAFQQQDLYEKAAENYRRAIELRPEYVGAYKELGRILYAQRQFKEAGHILGVALQLRPDDALTHYQLGAILSEQGDFEAARLNYSQAIRLQPKQLLWQLEMEMLSPPIMANPKEITVWRKQTEAVLDQYPAGFIDLEQMSATTSLPKEKIVPPYPPFASTYHGQNDRPLREKFARLFTVAEGQAAPVYSVHKQGRQPGYPYRIGFLVTRYHEGIFVKLMGGVLNHFSYPDFKLSIICPERREHVFRPHISNKQVDYFTIPKDASLAAEKIKAENFDLVYYWEIGTDSLNYALPFFQPAPVQCVSWGMPTTSGVSQVDYYISSELFENADADNHYTEQLIRLKNLPTCYSPPPLPSQSGTRSYFGLSAQEHIYLCCQNLMKMHPDFDEILGEILRQDIAGRVVLVESSLPKLNESLIRRLRKAIPDVVNRVQFVPRQNYNDYLNLIAVVDAVLDTPHFGAGNTALEILAVGTPIVTMPGQFMRGRMVLGCYRKMEMLDCVAGNASEYVQIAVRLGTNQTWQAAIKAKIKNSGKALFGDTTVVREFEQFFRYAIEKKRSEGEEKEAPVIRQSNQMSEPNHSRFSPVTGNKNSLFYEKAETCRRRGLALKKQGQLQEAVLNFRQALAVWPDYVEAHNNLGTTLAEQGQLDKAGRCFQHAIRLEPTYARAHYNLALVLQQQGKLDEAATHFEQVWKLEPDNAKAYADFGAILIMQQKFEEAVHFLQRAIEIEPGDADTYYNLGVAYQRLCRHAEAAENYRRIIKLRPDYVEAYKELGRILYAQQKFKEAEEVLRIAIQLHPDDALVYYQLGSILEAQYQIEAACSSYQQALHLNPNQAMWQLEMDMLCPAIMANNEMLEMWRGRVEASLERYPAGFIDLGQLTVTGAAAGEKIIPPYPPFEFAYHGKNDRPFREKFARLFTITGDWALLSGRKPLSARKAYRVGFLVTREHEAIFIKLMGGILDHFNSRNFEPFIICSARSLDFFRQHIKNQRLKTFVIPEDIIGAAEKIKAGNFDLVYYWEVGSDSLNYALPFFRLAPVQCTSWGLSITSGIPQMDYFISSDLLEGEGAESHYTEKLVKLKTLPTYYYRPQLPVPLKGRRYFGLPEETHLYLCPQALIKFHPDFDWILRKILWQDPKGKLVLLKGSNKFLTKILLSRFRKTMPDVLDRIAWVPPLSREDYLNLLAIADVILDTIYYGGGNTTHEALGSGTPVVTLPGRYLRGRLTLGRYKKMGVMDCVAASVEQYVEIAVRLGTDRAYHKEIKEKILVANAVLYEDIEAVREMEAFFGQAIEEKRKTSRNLPPATTTEETKINVEAQACRRRGLALKKQGQLQAAIDCFRQAVSLQPDYVEAYNNLGTTLAALGKPDESIAAFRQAVGLDPTYARAHYNLGVALAMQGDVGSAATSYRQAVTLKPNQLLWQLEMDLLCPPVITDNAAIDYWRQRIKTALNTYPTGVINLAQWQDAVSGGSNIYPPFHLAYHGRNERSLREKLAQLFVAPKNKSTPPLPSPVFNQYRIGFLATGNHEQGVLYFVAGLVNQLSRPPFKVSIICPALSVNRIKSAITNKNVNFLTIPENLPGAVEKVKAENFDLIYYWEIGTDTLNYLLPFYRLARVQCVSWGSPTTTGIAAVDYYISSELFEPEGAEAHYTERLVKLKSLPTFYARPPIPAKMKSRAYFGLTEEENLYLCCQGLMKLHPDFDKILGEIQRRDPNGRVVLVKSGQRWLNKALLQRLKKTIPEVADRVRFVDGQSYQDYLNLVGVADVILDTIHFSGGATTLEGLTVGTPIVTLAGNYMRGRMTLGCYQKMGVMDCVAASVEQYVEIAVRLGTDRAYHKEIKEKILVANAVLYEDIEAVREMESFFRQAIEEKRGTSRNLPLATTTEETKINVEAQACRQRGLALKKQGQLQEAVACFRQAASLQPNSVRAYNNLGTTLAELGKLDEAVAGFNYAIALQPDYARAHHNLGLTLVMQNKIDAAIESYRHALRVDPNYVMAHYNLGAALVMRNDIDSARASYQRALDLKPENTLWRLEMEMLCPAIMPDVEAITRWRGQIEGALRTYPPQNIALSDWLSNKRGVIYNICPPYNLAYHGKDDRPIREKFAGLFTVPRQQFNASLATVSRPGGQYRIGFLVTKAHEAIFVKLMGGIIDHLRSPDFQVAIICPAVSIERIKPEISNKQVDYLSIPENTLPAAEKIRRQNFDLIYHWEAGSDSLNYTLPFFRLAPVQCTSWGLSITSGIPQMDYFISSDLLESEAAESHYTERLVKLKTLPTYYYRPRLPSPLKGRGYFGVPKNVNLYLCPQNLIKFHPEFDLILGEILRQDPNGKLVLVEGVNSSLTTSLRQRFQKTIPNVLDRIKFVSPLPRGDYLNLMAIADVLLDTIYYGGGNTTHEALGSGTPLVTLPGRYLRSRLTLGRYRKTGVMDCVATSAAEYVKIAVRLGTDRAYRETIKNKILAANHVLYEDMEAVQEMEQFFRWAIDAAGAEKN